MEKLDGFILHNGVFISKSQITRIDIKGADPIIHMADGSKIIYTRSAEDLLELLKDS